MRIANPLVNFRPLGERNFAVSCIIIFCAYAVLYAASIVAAGPAAVAVRLRRPGLGAGACRPAGIFSIIMLLVVGILLGRGIDARWLIAAGLLVVAVGNYWMAQMNLEISPWQVVWPRMVLIAGLALIFAPLNVAAFKYTPKHLRGAAVGLLALLRNEGGSVGTSMAQTIQERREQFHTVAHGRIRSIPSIPRERLPGAGPGFFFQQTGDAAGRGRWPCKRWPTSGKQQAASLAYFDVFWFAAVVGCPGACWCC